MKITKTELRKLIKEAAEELENDTQQPKVASDVERVGSRFDLVAGIDTLLAKINTRIEFEQFLRKVIKSGSENVKPADILLAVRNVHRALRKEVK